MLTVTSTAAALLKGAKSEEGASANAGIRLRRGIDISDCEDRVIPIGFVISDAPEPGDQSFEQQGLLIFVESALIEPLDGRILDVRIEENRTELFFR
jgi:Fe-S cluster assembly iron-binding protein IscA